VPKLRHQGVKRRIWWADGPDGRYPGEEYWNVLETAPKAKLEALWKQLAERGYIYNERKFANEGDGIWAFKTYSPGHRLMCFFEGDDYFICGGYPKKGQEMPRRQKDRALRMKAFYYERKEQPQ
jgi:hypothetical protein